MTISAPDIATLCHAHDINFHSGVPCSLLSPVTNTIATADRMQYVNAAIEGESIAIAAGAWLAGKQAGIWIQNSGLGNTINPVTSLLSPFEIPVLYVTSRRGKPGVNDEPQHQLMGKITSDVLTSCGVEHAFLEDVSNQDDLDRLFVTAKSHLDNRKSYGIVIDKGCVEKVPYVGIDDVKERKSGKFENLCTDHVSDLPSRYEVLEYVAELSGTSRPIIATTGKTGRELFTIRDSANHFYMVGSMGYACSIGLGVAMNTNKQTIVIDGDGALLMNMGALATIGHFAPKNFVHIVIDNGLYESTGGQPTTSENVDFAAVAHHCGYHYAVNVDDLSSFNEVMKRMINSATAMVGPSLICIKASTNKIDDLARPDIHPRDVAARFREFLKGE